MQCFIFSAATICGGTIKRCKGDTECNAILLALEADNSPCTTANIDCAACGNAQAELAGNRHGLSMLLCQGYSGRRYNDIR